MTARQTIDIRTEKEKVEAKETAKLIIRHLYGDGLIDKATIKATKDFLNIYQNKWYYWLTREYLVQKYREHELTITEIDDKGFRINK